MSTRRATPRSPRRAASPARFAAVGRLLRSCRRWRRRTRRCRPGSGSGWAAHREPSTPRRSAPRRGTRRARCWAPPSRSRAPARSCSRSGSPPASPASSVAPLCADDVQRGRSPFADRLGDELASGGLRAGRRRDRSRRPRQRPLRRRGNTPGADPADRGREAARLSARQLHGPPWRGALDRQRRPRLLQDATVGEHLEPRPRPGRAHPRAAPGAGAATASTSPRSPAFTRASTR